MRGDEWSRRERIRYDNVLPRERRDIPDLYGTPRKTRTYRIYRHPLEYCQTILRCQIFSVAVSDPYPALLIIRRIEAKYSCVCALSFPIIINFDKFFNNFTGLFSIFLYFAKRSRQVGAAYRVPRFRPFSSCAALQRKLQSAPTVFSYVLPTFRTRASSASFPTSEYPFPHKRRGFLRLRSQSRETAFSVNTYYTICKTRKKEHAFLRVYEKFSFLNFRDVEISENLVIFLLGKRYFPHRHHRRRARRYARAQYFGKRRILL